MNNKEGSFIGDVYLEKIEEYNSSFASVGNQQAMGRRSGCNRVGKYIIICN